MAFAGFIPEYMCRHSENTTSASEAASHEDILTSTNISDVMNVCSVNGSECQDFQFLGDKYTVISEVS